MNINEKIIYALKNICKNIYPNVAKDVTNKSEYFVFVVETESPELFEGDTDTFDCTYVQVNYFSKNADIENKKKEIRKALRKAGFTITGTNTILDNNKTELMHIAVDCNIIGYINEGE